MKWRRNYNLIYFIFIFYFFTFLFFTLFCVPYFILFANRSRQPSLGLDMAASGTDRGTTNKKETRWVWWEKWGLGQVNYLVLRGRPDYLVLGAYLLGTYEGVDLVIVSLLGCLEFYSKVYYRSILSICCYAAVAAASGMGLGVEVHMATDPLDPGASMWGLYLSVLLLTPCLDRSS